MRQLRRGVAALPGLAPVAMAAVVATPAVAERTADWVFEQVLWPLGYRA